MNMLEPRDIETLKRLMKERMGSDVSILDELRGEIGEFKRNIRTIKNYKTNTMSIVGTDRDHKEIDVQARLIEV